MHLSTSSSEAAATAPARSDRRFERAIAMAVGGALLLWIGLEAASYFGLQRISSVERRRLADQAAARTLRPASPGAAPSVLIVGNSLLLEGLDYDGIRKAAAGRTAITRFAVENTSYYEWYFGIRRLLAEGSRPNRILLCLSPAQLIGNAIGSDYAMHYLILPGDLYAAGRAAGYDLTRTSGLFFSEYSLYYARRNTLRTLLMSTIAPSYWSVARRLTSQTAKLPASAAIERVAGERLRALDETARAAGIGFALLLPPGFGEGEREVVAAGEKAGATVLVPIHTGALPRSDFSDGFHLNAHGARIFTEAVTAELTAGSRQ